MKAYQVEYPGDGYEIETGMDLVYGNNREEAKKNFFENESFFGSWGYECDCRVSDVKFYRLKDLDDCENLSSMKKAEKLVVSGACMYWELGDKCFDEDNFDEQEFEKEWMKEYGSEQVCVV